jgi:opacity protein-like surface antigen
MREAIRFSVRILLVAVAISMATGLAVGGIGGGNGEIGFDFGFAQLDDEVSGDSGGRFSIRGGYFFTDLFQLEGQSAAIVVSEAEGTNIDISLSTFFINAVFNFHPSDQLVPYALVGYGTANLEFSNGGSIDDNSGAWQVAAGTRFFIGKSKRASVRVDLSYMSEETFDESSSHFSAVVGFSWRLGQEPQ